VEEKNAAGASEKVQTPPIHHALVSGGKLVVFRDPRRPWPALKREIFPPEPVEIPRFPP